MSQRRDFKYFSCISHVYFFILLRILLVLFFGLLENSTVTSLYLSRGQASDTKFICPNGSIEIVGQDADSYEYKCYMFVHNAHNWMGAQQVCAENYGVLAPVPDVYMNVFLASEAQDVLQMFYKNGFNMWLGCYDDGNMNCQDTDPVKFTNFGPDRAGNASSKNMLCVTLDMDGIWVMKPCLQKMPFVCALPTVGFVTCSTGACNCEIPTSPQPLTLPTPTTSTSTLPSESPTTTATTHASTNTHHPKHDSNATVTPNPVTHFPTKIPTESPSTVPPPTVPSTPESEGSSTPPPISSFFSCPNSNFSFDADTQTCYIVRIFDILYWITWYMISFILLISAVVTAFCCFSCVRPEPLIPQDSRSLPYSRQPSESPSESELSILLKIIDEQQARIRSLEDKLAFYEFEGVRFRASSTSKPPISDPGSTVDVASETASNYSTSQGTVESMSYPGARPLNDKNEHGNPFFTPTRNSLRSRASTVSPYRDRTTSAYSKASTSTLRELPEIEEGAESHFDSGVLKKIQNPNNARPRGHTVGFDLTRGHTVGSALSSSFEGYFPNLKKYRHRRRTEEDIKKDY